MDMFAKPVHNNLIVRATTAAAVPSTSAGEPPLQQLADVELQLVMQGLQAQELLQFARGSRRLLTLAKPAFVWQHTSPLSFSIPAPSRTSSNAATTVSVNSSRLLSHARSALKVRFPRGLEDATTEQVLALAATVTIESLQDDSGRLVPDATWERVFKHPTMQSLTKFSCECPTVRVLQLATSLPRLASLRLENGVQHWRAGGGQAPAVTADYEPLVHAPALTSLEICDAVGSASVMPVVVRCAHLQRLKMSYPTLYGDRFRAFFTSPAVVNLRVLELQTFHPVAGDPVPEADYAPSFQALRHLTMLTLSHFYGVDELLAHLHHAPALRELTILGTSAQSLPLGAALLRLMQAVPHLRVNLYDFTRAKVWGPGSANWREVDVTQRLLVCTQRPTAAL